MWRKSGDVYIVAWMYEYACDSASRKVGESLRCELNVPYGSSEREKYDIITNDSTPEGEIYNCWRNNYLV